MRRSLSASPGRRPSPSLARLPATQLPRTASDCEAPREGEGKGKGGTVQTAWPPSCLCPRSARAPLRDARFPSPPRCPGLCTALLRRGAGRLLLVPGLLRRGVLGVREHRREGGGTCEQRRGGGRGRASRLWRSLHFPRAAAAAVRSGLAAAMLSSRRGRRRRRARGVRAPGRPGPRAFSHWRKATAGGLARDWSVAGRPRTWYLIGRAGSGLGSGEGVGGCRDSRVWGLGCRVMTPCGAGVGRGWGTAYRSLRAKGGCCLAGTLG